MIKDRVDDVLAVFEKCGGALTIPNFKDEWEKTTGKKVSIQSCSRQFKRMLDKKLIKKTEQEVLPRRGVRATVYMLTRLKQVPDHIVTTSRHKKRLTIKVGGKWQSKLNSERFATVAQVLRIDGRPCVKLEDGRIIYSETLTTTYTPYVKEAPDGKSTSEQK